jgi:hypothetical protein
VLRPRGKLAAAPRSTTFVVATGNPTRATRAETKETTMARSSSATLLTLTLSMATADLILMPATARAAIELPKPSPSATVSQRVGLTDIKVEYSSPAVKGRKVWGELVPMNELWRTGANAATTITFSRDVKVAGKDVKAGTYALLTIPAEGQWTVIVNSDAKLPGTRGYDQAKDVARATVSTAAIPKRERLTFVFADTTDATTELRLEWDELAVRIPIETATEAQSLESIKGAGGDLSQAARYFLDANKEPARALQLAESAVEVDPSWINLFVLARAQAANGKFVDATATAKKSQELGLKAEYFFWKEDVEKSIAEWSTKTQ